MTVRVQQLHMYYSSRFCLCMLTAAYLNYCIYMTWQDGISESSPSAAGSAATAGTQRMALITAHTQAVAHMPGETGLLESATVASHADVSEGQDAGDVTHAVRLHLLVHCPMHQHTYDTSTDSGLPTSILFAGLPRSPGPSHRASRSTHASRPQWRTSQR